MEPNDIDRLLQGYKLPDPPQALERRVMAGARSRLLMARLRLSFADWLAYLLDLSGFGYVNWLLELASGQESEYRVTII